MTDRLLALMMDAALEAGSTIMDVYAEPIRSEQKSDGSPVTVADERAEKIILDRLEETGTPVLAEESAAAGNIPVLGDRFFIVDPLDGTKEFIKRNGQFTVNIALAENGQPVMGVVYAPALGQLFVGSADGAFEYEVADGQLKNPRAIKVADSGPMNVVASRSHGHAALEHLCEAFKVDDNVSVGSSLKFCLLARGEARLYPRFTPTCEWDTAAGQAVLSAAGGSVFAISGGELGYGKSEGHFYNPYFAAAADSNLAEQAATKMRELVGTEGDVK